MLYPYSSLFFFFNDTATTEIYTLSLHDALPILQAKGYAKDAPSPLAMLASDGNVYFQDTSLIWGFDFTLDRKSTRLNSSHLVISYAVFCLKKKKKTDRYNAECRRPADEPTSARS